MCNPALWMAALFAGKEVLNQGAAAKASKTQDKVIEQNQENALSSMRDQYVSQATASNEGRVSAGQQAFQNTLEAARQRAGVQASAAAAGVSGLSIDSLIQDATRQEASNFDALSQNREYSEARRVAEGGAIRSQTENRINAVQRSNFNSLTSLLQIAGAGAAGYTIGGTAGGGSAPAPSP